MSLDARISRLEESPAARCDGHAPEPSVIVLHAGDPDPEVDGCPLCGRALTLVVRVVYVDDWWGMARPWADDEGNESQ